MWDLLESLRDPRKASPDQMQTLLWIKKKGHVTLRVTPDTLENKHVGRLGQREMGRIEKRGAE